MCDDGTSVGANLRVSLTTCGWRSKVLKAVSVEDPERVQIASVGEGGSGTAAIMKTTMGIQQQPLARIVGGQIMVDGLDLLTMPERDRVLLRGTLMR